MGREEPSCCNFWAPWRKSRGIAIFPGRVCAGLLLLAGVEAWVYSLHRGGTELASREQGRALSQWGGKLGCSRFAGAMGGAGKILGAIHGKWSSRPWSGGQGGRSAGG